MAAKPQSARWRPCAKRNTSPIKLWDGAVTRPFEPLPITPDATDTAGVAEAGKVRIALVLSVSTARWFRMRQRGSYAFSRRCRNADDHVSVVGPAVLRVRMWSAFRFSALCESGVKAGRYGLKHVNP